MAMRPPAPTGQTQAPAEKRSALGRWLPAVAIILVGGWVFSPAFQGGWLWDDGSEITQNEALSDGFWKIWFAPQGLDYFPLKTTVQWVQWRLWHEQTLGYHLTSIGLHLLSAVLLWRLLQKLGLRLAWVGGLLFAIHPVAVESVAWISELKNTLSLPPLLLALGAYLDYDERGRRRDYCKALLLFLAAMLCKSSVVMFPVILLLYVWWKRGRIAWDDLRASAGFFAISLGLGLVTVWFQHHRAMVHTAAAMEGMMARMAAAGLAVEFYFAKCVFPAELLPVYPRWAVNPPSAVQFLPWFVIGTGFGVAWIKRTTWGRHAWLGAGCFVINLAPVLGFIPMAFLHISRVADHLVYLPLAGLTGLAAAVAGAAQARLPAPLRPYAGGAVVLTLGLLAFQSHHYAGCFRNQETLWTYTLERNPGAWIAHNNLGFARFEAGRMPEAIAEYETALRINPDSGDAHNNLANALFRGGRVADAIHHYEAALQINPDAMEVHSNLANALLKIGRVEKAVGHYEAAVRINPDSAAAQSDLGYVLLSLGQAAEAALHYEAAVRIDPRSTVAHSNLGYALLSLGRIGEATAHYEEALRIDPDNAPARSTLARLQTLQHAVEPKNGREISTP